MTFDELGFCDQCQQLPAYCPYGPSHAARCGSPPAAVAGATGTVAQGEPATGGRPSGATQAPATKSRARVMTMSDVKGERITWLWPGYLPAGKLAVVDGDPGVGKSCVTLDLAARVSAGALMPDGVPLGRPPGDVLVLSAEDGAADTIRPRLDAAGADANRVHLLVDIDDGGLGRPVDLASDIDAVAGVIRRVSAALVVIDPLMAYLGTGVDSHRDQDIRRALHPLAVVAADTGAAVVIVRHLTKSGPARAVYRGGGSIGIIGAARAGFLAAPDPAEPELRRVLAPTKFNVGQAPAALGYQIAGDEVHGCARVDWLGPSQHRADDLLAPLAGAAASARYEALDWLAGYLAEHGPTAAAEVKRLARESGIAERTLQRARRALGVVVTATGRSTMWAPPPVPLPGTEDGWDG